MKIVSRSQGDCVSVADLHSVSYGVCECVCKCRRRLYVKIFEWRTLIPKHFSLVCILCCSERKLMYKKFACSQNKLKSSSEYMNIEFGCMEKVSVFCPLFYFISFFFSLFLFSILKFSNSFTSGFARCLDSLGRCFTIVVIIVVVVFFGNLFSFHPRLFSLFISNFCFVLLCF